jgi:hypothetical protein
MTTRIVVGIAVTIFLVTLALYAITTSTPIANDRCRAAGYDHAAGLAGGDDFCVDAHGAVYERRRTAD